jgi:hypothetical protein
MSFNILSSRADLAFKEYREAALTSFLVALSFAVGILTIAIKRDSIMDLQFYSLNSENHPRECLGTECNRND